MTATEREPPLPLSRATAAALVAIVGVALALRLAMLFTARFGGDEALFFRIGMDIVEGRAFPLLGTQITDGQGMLPGPSFLYLMALPLLVMRAPEAQYAFTEILGAATVAVFFFALRRPFGDRGALVGAFVFAVSPWAALYADRTWNPNVLPFFVTLGLWAALRVRAQPHSRAVLVLVACLAVLPHLHMSAPVAWAGLLVVTGSAWRRVTRAHLLGAAALFSVFYIPLAIHEVSTGLGNTRAIFAETVAAKERHAWGFLYAPLYALRFLTLDATYHELTGYWGGPDESACLKAAVFGSPARPFHPLRVFAFATSLLLALSALVAFVRAARTHNLAPHGAPARLLLRAAIVAVAADTALLALAGKQVFGHYVIAVLPFALVAFVVLAAAVRARAAVAALGIALVVFAAGGVETTLSISRNIDARIGLKVHRAALTAIQADGVTDGNPDAPVRLDFGMRSSWYDWHIFGTRALHMSTLHFDKNAPRRYALLPPGRPAPQSARAEPPRDFGYARLFRLK